MQGRGAIIGGAIVLLGAAACGAFAGSDATRPNDTDSGAGIADGGNTSMIADGGDAPYDAGIVDDVDGADGGTSQFCGLQLLPPFLCQDFDESLLLAGWYKGTYAAKGNFSGPPTGVATVTLDMGRAHGYAPNSANQAFISSDAFAVALEAYTFTIRFHISQTKGDVQIALLSTVNGAVLTLAASATQVTLATPLGPLKIDMDTTTDHEAKVQYSSGQISLVNPGTGVGDALVDNVISLRSVQVGIGAPSSAPGNTFIDYYMVTTP